MVKKHLIDNSTDMLFQSPSNVIWVPYNKFHVGNYDNVHYDNNRRWYSSAGSIREQSVSKFDSDYYYLASAFDLNLLDE